MELWLAIIIAAYMAVMVKACLWLNNKNKSKNKLPPGPQGVPILTSIQWLRKTTMEVEEALQSIYSKYGPIITLSAVSRPFIFISSPSLAHEALIQKGAIFANRPDALPTARFLTSNQLSISSASYGPTWRLLRRNLMSSVVHPSQAKDFSHARKWVLDILLGRLRGNNVGVGSGETRVAEHFGYSMFALLVFMCFGDKLPENQIKDIQIIQYQLLTSFNRFQILNLSPALTKILLKTRWKELFNLRSKRSEILLPHIRARMEYYKQNTSSCDKTKRMATSYVDSLFELEISENGHPKRKLTEEELVTLCSEFLNAGTDTTSTALQWIMANLVKFPAIQDKVYQEIKELIGTEAKEVGDEDLPKMPYLKAVVLEALRRHPPTHFSLPHAVSEEVDLGGYKVPKNAVVFFTFAEMCRDSKVWKDPMEFKPERFMSNEEEIDITGSREIKMMPFGVGRRICPALRLAMLHLEYYVANLVWNFKWTSPDGYDVDLSEKQEFTIVMKHPLHAHLAPR
ncbi:cytochrome P450 89A2-like [Silene latifolia]|uniref:cytochrome P450 89A2-like n=1 Tax=Silene latifolia TaxID=37657 RepID=UPI003D782DE1